MLLPMLLVIAGLVGWVVIRHKTVGTSSTGATPPSGTDAQVVNVGGINLVTKPSSYDQAALANSTNVPDAYDLDTPQTAQRRIDAINRGIKLENNAAAQGMTAEGVYQQHLAVSVAATRDDPTTGGFDYAAAQKSIDGLVAQGISRDQAQVLVAAPAARRGAGHL